MTEKNEKVSSDGSKKEVNTIRKLPQYMAGLSATIGALAAGLVIGWTSPAGEDGSNLVYSFAIDANDFSWLSSIFNLGAAASCIPVGMLMDALGRKRALLILVTPFTIGWICIIWPNSVMELLIGRFLLGISGGAIYFMVPTYTAEIADSETRGRLGSYCELFCCIGVLMSYTLGLLDNMFILSLISASVPLIFFVLFFFMPETPTYFLMKGNVDAARNNLIWLRGPHYDVQSELDEKQTALIEAKREKVSFLKTIRSKASIKGLVIGYGLMLFQQLSGINAVVFYAGSIFNTSGDDDSNWPSISVGAAMVIAVILNTQLIDKWGRRAILLMSAVIMCFTHLVLGVYFYLQHEKYSLNGVTWIPIVCICGFVIAMEFGFGPIPFMMIGEIFSPTIRGIAGSSAGSLNWFISWIVTKYYGDVKVLLGDYGVFWIFSGICGLGVIFVWLLVPETKGKSLEKIQIELERDSWITACKCENDNSIA